MGLALVALGTLLTVLLPLAYHRAALRLAEAPPPLRSRRICLLIAHPDDEAMFFAPTVLALARPAARNHLTVLCLSAGNAAGLGHIRRRELMQSALLLGLRDADDIVVIDDDTRFPDSMTAAWSPDDVAAQLASVFATPAAADISMDTHLDAPLDAPIHVPFDVLVTFDAHGVSSHPNHISLYHGATHFLRRLVAAAPADPCPVHLYTLRSVGMARKYASVVDGLVALLAAAMARPTAGPPSSAAPQSSPATLVFANPLAGLSGLPAAWRAMTHAHKSQMVWFRWLWIMFSRYMIVNELHLDHIS